jgi:exosortase
VSRFNLGVTREAPDHWTTSTAHDQYDLMQVSLNRPQRALFLYVILLCAGALLAFVSWDQSHWWISKADYTFGWIVPVCVAYAIHDRWPQIVRFFRSDLYPHFGDTNRHASLTKAVSFAFGSLCGISAIVFLLSAAYRSAGGPSNPATLGITSGAIGIILSSLYFITPAVYPNIELHARLKFTALFIFPLFVWLISAPLIGLVEAEINIFLMKEVTSVVFFVFDALGLALEQRGNVLVLPTGSVGVAEACSGIRSLTGCLFAGSFLAAIFLETWSRKILLVAASLLLALFTNLLRSLFLTAWSYRFGAESMEKNVHDLAGYAVLGLTVVGLLFLLPLLNQRPPLASRARETRNIK